MLLQSALLILCLTQFAVSGYNVSQCYANQGKALEISCAEPSNGIVIHSLKLGSKPISLESNCTDSFDFEHCCLWDPEHDCTFDYDSQKVFRQCQGKSECQVPVVWAQNTERCLSSKYGRFTQYMVAEYSCINPDSNIIDMCSPASQRLISRRGKLMYLRNLNYPEQDMGNCWCRIKTANNMERHRLQVKAVSVYVDCQQSLTFFDESETEVYPTKNITCSESLNGLKTVYTSEGTSPTISMWHQTLKKAPSYVWVEVSVEPIETTVEVSCSTFKNEELSNKLAVSMLHTTESPTSLSQYSPRSEDETNILQIILPVMVLVLIIPVVIVIIVIRRRKRKHDLNKILPMSFSTDHTYDNSKSTMSLSYPESYYESLQGSMHSFNISESMNGKYSHIRGPHLNNGQAPSAVTESGVENVGSSSEKSTLSGEINTVCEQETSLERTEEQTTDCNTEMTAKTVQRNPEYAFHNQKSIAETPIYGIVKKGSS